MQCNVATVEEAWSEYQRRLLAFIRPKVETPEDAEDILLDVFEKLAKTASENTIPDNVSSWLYRVTKNRIVDYYRAKKRYEQLPDDLSEHNDDAGAIAELSECILPMIRTLPELYQRPLLLSEIEGKKYKTVAAELGLSLSAVKSRILRGRNKLHEIVADCCSIYRNEKGEVIDYEQKTAGYCSDGDN